MKITAVTTFVTSMPMLIAGDTPMVGGRPRTAIETLLVRVDTDAGISGWGEAFGHRVWPVTRTAIDRMIAPLCIGRDPTAITALMHDLAHTLHGAGRSGPAMYGMSAIDIALWDIAGKAYGVPVYALLGGAFRTQVAPYATGFYRIEGQGEAARLAQPPRMQELAFAM